MSEYNGGAAVTGYKIETRSMVAEQQVILARAASNLNRQPGPIGGGGGGGGGGQFKLGWGGQTIPGCLEWNATATDVQAALESLNSLATTTRVSVSRMDDTNTNTHTMWIVTFLDSFTNIAPLVVTEGVNTGPYCASGIDGTAPTNTPCVFPFTYQGTSYVDTCRQSGTNGLYNGKGWCPTSSTYPTSGYLWGSCITCPVSQCNAFGNDFTYTDAFDSSKNIPNYDARH